MTERPEWVGCNKAARHYGVSRLVVYDWGRKGKIGRKLHGYGTDGRPLYVYDISGPAPQPPAKNPPGKRRPKPGVEDVVKLRGGLRCPHCGAGPDRQRVLDARCGHRSDYQCPDCGKKYSAWTGTILENAKAYLRPKLLKLSRAIAENPGISMDECAAILGASKPTAWMWRRRILAALLAAGVIKADDGGVEDAAPVSGEGD